MHIRRHVETERESGEVTEEEKKEPEVFRAASLVVRGENSEEVTPYISEETGLSGRSYILVVDNREANEDGACHLLKDVFGADDAGAVYESAENEEEAGCVLEVFQTILEDKDTDIDLLDE